MNIKNTLPAVLTVKEELCVNCFACIHACPVKECNNANGKFVDVNNDLCIACGQCIEACTHKARVYIDDFDKLFVSLSKGEKTVAIVSPAITANFSNHLKFNGLLRSLGVDAIFDMAMGAELAAISLAEYIEKENPQLVISQQCPAIVNYIQLYKPELIKYLAPVDSPLMHTAKMIKRFYPEYENHKIVYISTCNAAKREFDELKIGDYNVAFDSIRQYIENHNINIENLPEENYINPAVESGAIIAISGGYTQLLERFIPNISEQTQKISGGASVYPYINSLPNLIASGKNPLFVDGLSCSGGCNAKALLCSNQASAEENAFDIRKRKQVERQAFAQKAKEKNLSIRETLYESFSKYIEHELYLREYVNRWQNFDIVYPNAVELRDVYKKMHKYTDKDLYNCTSCGYFSCERMAVAVFNGLNKPENCKFFIEKESEKSHNQVIEAKSRLQNILDTSLDGFIQVDTIGLIRDANPALKELLKKSDIIGKTLHSFFDIDNKKKLDRELKTLNLNLQHVFEIELTNSESQNISCRISASQLFNLNKEPNGFFAIVSDISNLKQAEEDLRHVNEQLEQKVQLRTAELSKMLEELNETQTIIEERNQELNSTLQSLNDAQTLVKENENKLSSIIACMPDAVMVIDRQGVVVTWNEVMEKLTGVKAENIIGKGNYEYAIPFYGDRRKVLIDLVFESVEVLQTKYSTVERNGDVLIAQAYSATLRKGQEVYMHGTARALRNDAGEIIGAIEIVRDITQTIEAEEKIKQQMFEIKEQQEEMLSQNEELRQTTEELAAQRDYLEETMKEVRTAERKITSIIECMPDAVMVIDRQGVVLTWNEEMEVLTGIKAKEIIGKGNYEYALPFYGERRKILIDLVFESLETFKEKYTTVDRNGDILIAETYSQTLLNGSGVHMRGMARALKNEMGEVIGAIEIVRNRNQSVLAEQKIQYQLVEIQEQQEEMLSQNEELRQTTEELAAQRDYLEDTMKEVRTAERKITSIIECMPDAVMVIDRRGVIQTWNQGMEELTGIKANDIIGKGNYEYSLPFYGDRRKTLIDLVFEPLETFSEKYTTVERNDDILTAQTYSPTLRNGRGVYMHGTARALKNEAGEVVGAIEIVRDVTETVIAEQKIQQQLVEIKEQQDQILTQNEELQQTTEEIAAQRDNLEDTMKEVRTAERKIASIVECMPDAVMVIDKKGIVQTWNKEMELLTGVKADDIIGKGDYEYALPFYGERRKILIDLIFESKDFVEKNYSSVQKVGDVLFAKSHLPNKDLYMHCTATELKDENGKVVGAIEIIKNVTESVLAEKQIQKQMSEIQQQHEELLSQNEEIRVINETLEDQKNELEKILRKLKTTQSQLIQSEKMAALGKLIAGVAHEVNTPLGAIKSSSEEITLAYQELMKELPQGVKQLTDSDLQVFQDLLDKALNTTVTLSTREERALKRNLSQILQPAGFEDPQYIAGRLIQIGITELHETEIEFLKNYPNMVSSVLYNAAIQFKNNENVKLAVDKASRVIMALKMYSHSNSDNVQSSIDITKSIETVLTIYHNQIKKGIVLNKSYQEVPMVIGYPDKLNQVWTNLIQNAIQAMNYAGTMSIHISLIDKQIEVSIQDSGCGIPEEIHTRIFDPFFTTKKAGEGSGLGLDIVKKIVEEHNGTLSFKSEVGVGTTFFVHLPIS